MSTESNSSANDASQAGSESTARNSRVPLLICVVVSLLIGYLFFGPILPKNTKAGIATKPKVDEVVPERQDELLLPSKSLSPEQVVAAQMEALVECRTDRSAIHQVFVFASPANRAVTGPIGRFEQMIRQSAYNSMVESDYWMAGRAVTHEGQATVLVTTIDASEQVSLYRFYLSKQTSPYEDCWMTDRVIPLVRDAAPPIAESPLSDDI